MNEENELPSGWVWTTFDELIMLSQNGCSKRRSVEGKPTIVLRLSDISEGRISLADVREVKLTKDEISSYKLSENDLVCIRVNGSRNLVGRMMRFGSLSSEPIAFCDHFIRFRLVKPELATFLSLYFETEDVRRHIEFNMVSSAGQNTVSQGTVTSISIPLPPLTEQQRIVAAIEQQFSRLDVGVSALRRAQAKLKRYRAAVLKAAVEGKLTETWRAEHPTTEPASRLLERVLAERRAKWEADLRAKGKDPAKVRYLEPAKPDTVSLPELPEAWCWVSLQQCSYRVTDGTHQPPKFTQNGIPFIFVAHIVKGTISFENTKYISESTYKELNTRCPVEPGDILYSAVGSYGVAVPVLTDSPFSFQRHIAHIKPSTLLLMKYLTLCLNSPLCLDHAHTVARGVAQKTVTLTDLAQFAIPLPPFTEQEQIVAEVERRLSVVSQLEATVETNLKRAERLRQSILKEAFAGRLVPQDPSDEPASVLLERIRGEREKRKHKAPDKGHEVICEVAEPVKIDVRETRQVELWESISAYPNNPI